MSPKSKQQFEEIREASTNKILMAALDLFGTHGYDATSISELAAKAKISKGLIYNYFESKEHILREVLALLGKQEGDMMSQIQDPDPRKMMENTIRVVFAKLRKDPDLLKLVTSLAIQVGKFDFIHESAVQKLHHYYELFEDLLKQIGVPNPDKEAMIIGALLDGVALQYLILEKDYPFEEIEDYLVKKYCRNAT